MAFRIQETLYHIRAMVAFGVTTLCVTDNCVDVFHPKAVNASSGGLVDIKIYNESHWADWLPHCHPYVLDPIEAAVSITQGRIICFDL